MLLREDLVRDEKVDVLGRELSLSPSTVTRATTADVARVTEDLLLEDLRRWAAETNTAAAGLVLLFSLYSRLPEHANDSPGWIEIGTQSSERQPSFLHFVQVLEDHLQDAPTLADTIAWLVRRFVIGAHEQIAYSKLPEFTFRFRWEGGRLRFYSLGLGRFDLADIRRQSMSRISEDVGLWEGADGQVRLTPPGVDFLEEVFGS